MNKDSSQHDELNDSPFFFFFDHRVECRATFSGTCQDLKIKNELTERAPHNRENGLKITSMFFLVSLKSL